jgi:hypothetical protein
VGRVCGIIVRNVYDIRDIHGSREPGQELSGLIGGCPAGYLHIYIFIKIKLNR